MSHYDNRYNLWNKHKDKFKKVEAKLGQSYSYFEQQYFKSENNIQLLHDLARNNFGYPGDISQFYKTFACDLDWAKQTEYCKVAPAAPKPGISIIKDQNIIDTVKAEFPQCIQQYPLYLEIGDDGSETYFIYFKIGEGDEMLRAKYYKDGRVLEKEGNKPGKVKRYTCDDTKSSQTVKDNIEFPEDNLATNQG